jgi:predicted esterase
MGRLSTSMMVSLHLVALALPVQLVSVLASVVQAQQPGSQPAPAPPAADAPTPAAQAPGGGRGGRGQIPVDPRVQIRTHHFADMNEDIPYAVFVSSKVARGKRAPMIVSLHGLGGTHTTMMRPNAIDLAEAGGYILLAPMGYNPRGWYGVPAGPRRGGPPPNASPNPAAAAPSANPGRQGPPPGVLNGANDPPNVRELSEKETLEVVDLVRKEFNVDDKRTYLMGHSMGGAGTFYLAVKYPQRWAAIAAIAPAAFGLQASSLNVIPKMPVMVVHGDMDAAVPVSLSRTWVEVMKALKMPHQYIEVPGGDHGSVISSHQAEIFAFFAKHSK